jgi:hypothetical protein
METITLDNVVTRAAAECIDERERYLVIFTHGVSGYVCRNAEATDESQALYKGLYRDCQIWIERRGIAVALRYVLNHLKDIPEMNGGQLSLEELLARISQIPK